MIFKIFIILLHLYYVLTSDNLAVVKPRRIWASNENNVNALNIETSMIANKKCMEYSQLYNKYSESCQDQEIIKKTVKADATDFPHMARIGYTVYNQIYWACMGSLISEEYILTAANCLDLRSLGPATIVRLGTLNKFIDFNITETIVHPDYRNKSNYNDIGLIRLNGKVTFNEYIRPACLAYNNEKDYRNAIWTGIDSIEEDYEEPSELKQVTLEFFTRRECHKSFLPYKRLHRGIHDDIQFCAGKRDDGQSSCLLYGGPLQVTQSNLNCMNTLVGVSSFGIFDCSINGFTDVFSYIKWIEKIVWTN